MSHDVYESPLAGRYASPYMLHLFSPDMRFQTWRRLWTALARAQHDLGLPVTEEQVRQLEQHITDIDYDTARQREREVRHDVMAHVYTYGKAAPLAAGIIHSGGHQLLRHRQRRPDPVPGRAALSPGPAAGGDEESLCLCGEIRRHAHPGLYPLSARPACHRGQAGLPVAPGSAVRPGGAGFCPGEPALSGLPGHHRHRGQLHGSL